MTEREPPKLTDASTVLPEGEVLRLNEWGQGIGALIAGFAVLGGLFLIFVPAVGHGHLEGASRRELGVAWLLVGAFFVQTARAGIIVTTDGIKMRGLFRRRSWTWQQIDHFELTKAFYIQPLRISLRDNSHARARGFKPSSAGERTLAESRVAELNRRVNVCSNSAKPRPLTEAEMRLIDQMLAEPFRGRDELLRQLENGPVVVDGPADTRTIVFAPVSGGESRAHVIQRIPVDASMPDLDGTDIDLLLHVVDGYAHELEAYRVDGAPIERRELNGPIRQVNRYPRSYD